MTKIEERAKLLSKDGNTVLVIPHDINTDTVIAVDGEVTSQKFNQIQLRGVIGDAERRRLDMEFERVSKRLKTTILPEE